MKTRRFALLFTLMITASLFLTSCGVETEELTLEKYNLTLTVPKLKAAPEFMNLKLSERDTELSRYDFKIGKRVNVIEVVEKVFPENLSMLKEAISADESFIEIRETKEFANKVFGVIFKKKGSSGKEIKYYLFYAQKGGRFFKMEPVFNSELKELSTQLSAFESIK